MQPSFFKRHQKTLIMVTVGLAIGYITGRVTEQASYQREIAGRILNEVEQGLESRSPKTVAQPEHQACAKMFQNLKSFYNLVEQYHHENTSAHTILLQKLENIEQKLNSDPSHAVESEIVPSRNESSTQQD